MFISLLFLGFFSTIPAQASCPVGQAASKRQAFTVVTGNLADGAPKQGCAVELDRIVYEPMEIVGCYPASDYPEFLKLKTPQGWTHKCFATPPESIVVPAREFIVRDNKRVWPFRPGSLLPFPQPLPMEKAAKAEDCPPLLVPVESAPVEPVIPAKEKQMVNLPVTNVQYYAERKNAIVVLINDLVAAENNLKTLESVEKYHGCLLSQPWEKEQNKIYKQKYRHSLQQAADSFQVPLPLLTCLCGRESRFKKAAVSNTGVKGLCQTTGNTLIDIEKWRSTIPEVNKAWNDFVSGLGKDLEQPWCAKAKLNSQTLAACPSLGFGAGAIYLQYANSRVEKNERFKNVHWQTHELDTLVTLAAAYNLGVGLTVKALRDVNKNKWQRTLLNATCQQFSKDKVRAKSKFKELKGHMVALRSCLQEDNWLDHHGNPLGGECTMDERAIQHQKSRLARFEATIPKECVN
jgi:hypothetical protein